MDYVNASVMAFEPVVEYWTFRVGVLAGGCVRAGRRNGCWLNARAAAMTSTKHDNDLRCNPINE